MTLEEKLKKAMIAKVLYDAFYKEEENVLDLTYLDFSEYNCNVDISCIKVNGDLYQDFQEVEGNLSQQCQSVKGKLRQSKLLQ